MCYGLVFDVDGVIADTEALIAEATIRMFRQLYNTEMTPADFFPFIGTGAVRYVEGPAEKYGVTVDIDRAVQGRHEHFVQLLEASGDIALPGARALIEAAAADPGWKLALATSSPGEKSRVTLAKAKVDPGLFDAWVHGDMITHKKPHPEIYLRAAEEIGLSPQRCIAVEDAVTGVAAAKAADMHCLAVTNSFPQAKLGQADCVAASLEAVDLERLRGVITAH